MRWRGFREPAVPDPAYLPTREKEAANYREMADTLAEAGCDLLVMEMMMDVERASLVTEAALATGLPVWVGISASRRPGGEMVGWDIVNEVQSRLPEGYEAPAPEPLEAIVDALAALGPQVVGIMHSSLESTWPGLEVLFERWNGPVMTYPEAIHFDAAGRRTRELLDPEIFATPLPEDGCAAACRSSAGCCGTTVDHIRALVDGLPERPGPRPHPVAGSGQAPT